MQKSYLWALVGVALCTAGMIRPAQAAPPAAVPAQLQAFPGPGAVLLTYSSALGGTSYNIYRRDHGQAADQATKVGSSPYTWFIDDGGGQGLALGKALLYNVKAVLADGKEAEASKDVVVTPQQPILGGMTVHAIGTTDPTTVEIKDNVMTVRAAGFELWSADDQGGFIGTAVSGDYSVSTKQLAIHSTGHAGAAKAGPMIRESLEVGARYAIQAAFRGRGVKFERRTNVLGAEGSSVVENGTAHEDTTYPLWLKLTKEGAIITAFQSSDGSNWEQVGTEADFGLMGPVTYAGLGASAVNQNVEADRYITTTFDATYGIKIE
jgi:hypothetical protein